MQMMVKHLEKVSMLFVLLLEQFLEEFCEMYIERMLPCESDLRTGSFTLNRS
jgi:hypothetical protein